MLKQEYNRLVLLIHTKKGYNTMELIKIKLKDGYTYRLNRFPQEIKNGKLEYFTYDEGYKKTTKFEIMNNSLPELNRELSWLDICKIHDL